MNWVVFAIFTYLMLAIQQGLAPLLDLQLGRMIVTPQLMMMLAVYVGLFAPRTTTVVAWGILGLLVDLTCGGYPLPNGGELVLVGPYTLGFLAGAYVMSQFRSMVFRRHPVSMGFLIVISGMAVELVVVLLLTIRQTYDPMVGWSAMNQLAMRAAAMVYTGALGVLGAIVLLRLTRLFGFVETRRPRVQVY